MSTAASTPQAPDDLGTFHMPGDMGDRAFRLHYIARAALALLDNCGDPRHNNEEIVGVGYLLEELRCDLYDLAVIISDAEVLP